MKKLIKSTKIVSAAIVLSIAATANHGSNTHVDDSTVTSSGIDAPSVTSEGAWEQWPNHSKSLSSNGRAKKKMNMK